MRRFVAACFSVLLTACASTLPAERVDHRVLFIGNSLTYYNDLPRTVQAMYVSAAPGRVIEVDMLASGGATMADHVRQGRMAELLAQKHYDVVILQDAGGFPACASEFPGCQDAVAGVCDAARIARGAKVRPILFGTYQAIPEAQAALSEATRDEAQRCGVELADVGAAMQRFKQAQADVSPCQKDGHPNVAGSWIAGAVLTRAIAGRDVPAERSVEPFCRQHWQDAKLELAELASTQTSLGSDCEMPPETVMQAAIRAAKAGAD